MLGQFGLNVLPLNTNGNLALGANAASRTRAMGTVSLTGQLTLSPSASLRNRQTGLASLTGRISLSPTSAARLRDLGTASLNYRLTLSPTSSPRLRATGLAVISQTIPSLTLLPASVTLSRVLGVTDVTPLTTLGASSAERLKAYGLPSFAPGTLRLYPVSADLGRVIPVLWFGYFGIQFGEALPEWVDNPFLEPLPAEDSEPRELKAKVYRSFTTERIR